MYPFISFELGAPCLPGVTRGINDVATQYAFEFQYKKYQHAGRIGPPAIFQRFMSPLIKSKKKKRKTEE
jgi:hypothetical protein